MTARRAAVLAFVCLVLSGCAVTVSGHPVATTPTTGTTTTATTPTTSTTPGAVGELLAPAPAGSQPWVSAWARDQLPSAEEFVARVYDEADRPTETARLHAQGLVAIGHRTWVASDSNQADMVLLQFADDSGATSRLRTVTSAKAATPNIKSFTVPTTPSAVGYYDPSIDNDGNYRAIVYGQKASIVMELFYYCPAPFSTTDAISWATAQMQRLP